uniref:Cytochrome P450 2J2-like n=1 Tax=Nothoprocta perdicaria TaxID=30464 RepID=A0A8C7EBZ2_NOTPE
MMLGIIEVFIVLVASLLILQFLKLQWMRNQLPPGPAPLPVFGNLWLLNFKLRRETLLTNTYGNIYTVWLGQSPVVVLNGYKAVKDGLVTHSEELSGRPLTPFYADMMGIFLTSGHTWKQQRRFGMTVIRSLGLGKNSLEHQIQMEASHLVDNFANTKAKVQREIEAVLEPSQLISYEDRKKLPYTNAVIHETLRYSNITSVGVPRQCVRNTTLLGFPIKQGTLVLPNLHSVVYDSEHWEAPWKFNPDHFLDLDGNFVNKEAFLPFSAGHRVCLGEQMARVELFIFFTSLLRAFTFQIPEGVKEINLEYILGAILQPHAYKLCAIPR